MSIDRKGKRHKNSDWAVQHLGVGEKNDITKEAERRGQFKKKIMTPKKSS